MPMPGRSNQNLVFCKDYGRFYRCAQFYFLPWTIAGNGLSHGRWFSLRAASLDSASSSGFASSDEC